MSPKYHVYLFLFITFIGFISQVFAQIPVEQATATSTPYPYQASAAHSEIPVSPAQKTDIKIEKEEAKAENFDNKTKEKESVILNPWTNKLPFAVTLEKLRSFIIVGEAIKKVNNNWDVLIASAQTDELALQYNSQASEEVSTVMRDIPGITLEEYKAFYDLSLNDPDFAMLLRALKEQVYPDADD